MKRIVCDHRLTYLIVHADKMYETGFQKSYASGPATPQADLPFGGGDKQC